MKTSFSCLHFKVDFDNIVYNNNKKKKCMNTKHDSDNDYFYFIFYDQRKIMISFHYRVNIFVLITKNIEKVKL